MLRQAGQIPIGSPGARGKHHKCTGGILPQQLLQHILLQLQVLQQKDMNSQLRAFRNQALQIQTGQPLLPGLDGEGPGNVEAPLRLHLPNPPGSFAASFISHIDAKGLQNLAVTGFQRPVQKLVIRTGLILQNAPAQGQEPALKGTFGKGEGQINQISHRAVCIPFHIPQGPVHRTLYENPGQISFPQRNPPSTRNPFPLSYPAPLWECRDSFLLLSKSPTAPLGKSGQNTAANIPLVAGMLAAVCDWVIPGPNRFPVGQPPHSSCPRPGLRGRHPPGHM